MLDGKDFPIIYRQTHYVVPYSVLQPSLLGPTPPPGVKMMISLLGISPDPVKELMACTIMVFPAALPLCHDSWKHLQQLDVPARMAKPYDRSDDTGTGE